MNGWFPFKDEKHLCYFLMGFPLFTMCGIFLWDFHYLKSAGFPPPMWISLEILRRFISTVFKCHYKKLKDKISRNFILWFSFKDEINILSIFLWDFHCFLCLGLPPPMWGSIESYGKFLLTHFRCHHKK